VNRLSKNTFEVGLIDIEDGDLFEFNLENRLVQADQETELVENVFKHVLDQNLFFCIDGLSLIITTFTKSLMVSLSRCVEVEKPLMISEFGILNRNFLHQI
jgi:hypothetical protein